MTIEPKIFHTSVSRNCHELNNKFRAIVLENLMGFGQFVIVRTASTFNRKEEWEVLTLQRHTKLWLSVILRGYLRKILGVATIYPLAQCVRTLSTHIHTNTDIYNNNARRKRADNFFFFFTPIILIRKKVEKSLGFLAGLKVCLLTC